MAAPGISSPYAARPWLQHYDYWVRPHMNYPRRPLYEILRTTAAQVPDRPATAFLGAHLTFAEIKKQTDAFAQAIHAAADSGGCCSDVDMTPIGRTRFMPSSAATL